MNHGHHTPTITGRSLDTGEVLTWRAGEFSGHEPYVVLAEALRQRAAGKELPLTPTGPWVPVDDSTDPVAAVAIVYTVLRGRVEWDGDLPVALTDLLDPEGEDGPEVVY